MGATPDAEFYGRMRRKHLQHRPLMARYWDLVGGMGAQPERSEPTPEWQGIEAAAVAKLKALPN